MIETTLSTSHYGRSRRWLGCAALVSIVCMGFTGAELDETLRAGQRPSEPVDRAVQGGGPAAPLVEENPEVLPAEPTLLERAVLFIEPFEGRRHRAYRDSLGHLTVGVGFNLDRAGAADDLGKLLPSVGYRALRRGEVALTDDQIDRLLAHDTRRAIRTARRQVEGFDALPLEVRLIVVDMTYNTGSLHTWKNFRAALAHRDYSAAANAMQRSLWRRQTGGRAKHLIQTMRGMAGS